MIMVMFNLRMHVCTVKLKCSTHHNRDLLLSKRSNGIRRESGKKGNPCGDKSKTEKGETRR